MKKILSFYLITALLCGLLPVAAYAVESGNPPVLYNPVGQDATPLSDPVPADAADYTFDAVTGTIEAYLGAGGNVTVPAEIDGVRVLAIGDGAFAGRSDLTKVTLPNRLTAIGENAFLNCANLTQLYITSAEVTSIGAGAFDGVGANTYILVPTYETRILLDAVGVPANRIVVMAMPHPDYEISSATIIKYLGDGGDVVIPDKISLVSPRSIGPSAFADCVSLTGITMSDEISIIGETAFSNCVNLTNVTFGSFLSAINTGAFSGCAGLTGITIPGSVNIIGDAVFSGCDNLNSIYIEATQLHVVSDSAFEGLPNDVIISVPYQSIKEAISGKGVADENIIVRDPTTEYLFDAETGTIISYVGAGGDVVIPAQIDGVDVTVIGNSCFDSLVCKSVVTSVVIPSGATTLMAYSFAYQWHLERVTIPDSMVSIGEWAFYDCSSLKEIYLESTSLTVCYDTAFKNLDPDAIIYVMNDAVKAAVSGKGVPDERIIVLAQAAIDLSEADIAPIPALTYNGAAQQPSIAVTFEGEPLMPGVDYDVSYSNHKNVGTATATLTGIGRYTGTRTAQFSIEKAVLTVVPNDCSIEFNAVAPAFTYTVIGFLGEDGDAVLSGAPVLDTDYNIGDPVRNYNITAVVGDLAAENYAFVFSVGTLSVGLAAQGALTVDAVAAKVYGDAAFTLTASGGSGDGAISYYIERGGDVIRLTDATVTILNAGTASVFARKEGDSGHRPATSAAVTITVYPRNIALATVAPIAEVTYNGLAHTPALTVTGGVAALVLDTDYTVSYSDHVNAGTVTVTLTGMENCTGTQEVQFSIAKKELTIAADSYSVTQGDPLPQFGYTVTGLVGNDALTAEPSLTCAAADSTVPGTFAITPAGADAGGNYSVAYTGGTLTVTSSVGELPGAPSVADAVIAPIPEANYNGAAHTPALTAVYEGTPLVLDTDYTASYSNNLHAGTATVTITGIGGYTGTQVAEFIIQTGTVTITATDFTISKGNALPAFDSTIVGLIDGDALLVPPSYDCDTDGSSTGTFTITPKGADAGVDYVIAYVSGILTVNSPPAPPVTDKPLGSGGGSAPAPEPEPAPSTAVFTDVEHHWAAEAIAVVVNRGLFNGVSDSTFDPGGAMTRAMFATVLARLAGADLDGWDAVATFSDVPTGQWFSAPINWAASLGIVSGVGGGLFAPGDPVTREQIAVMLYHYINLMDYAPAQSNAAAFTDADAISSWAVDAVAFMQSTGLLTGKDGGIFDPQATATRAEVATIFARLIDTLGV